MEKAFNIVGNISLFLFVFSISVKKEKGNV